MAFPNTRAPRLTAVATALASAALVITSIGVVAQDEVTMRSNASDPTPKKTLDEVLAYCTEQTGYTVKVNTIQHEDYQDQFSQALQADPEDILTWFAGFRMRYFADQGLFSPITDVWDEIGGNFNEAYRIASTGNDGEQYFIPMTNYPWVVNYRKSVWEENGWTPPATLEELKAIGDDAQAKGIVPIAFADKQNWPAMGWFDILNMRQNGYQFHVDLMAGNESWTDDRTKAVFEAWRDLMPYMQEGALSRDWGPAALSVLNGDSAMMLIGTFFGDQIPVYAGEDATEEELAALYDDYGFFPFPALGTEWDDEMGIDAPIDGYILGPDPDNVEGAKAILACLGSGPAQDIFHKTSPTWVATASDADTSAYNAVQVQASDIIQSAGGIAQFLDRDTRPEFSGPQAMGAFIKEFIGEPDQDLDGFLKRIQDYWDTLPPL